MHEGPENKCSLWESWPDLINIWSGVLTCNLFTIIKLGSMAHKWWEKMRAGHLQCLLVNEPLAWIICSQSVGHVHNSRLRTPSSLHSSLNVGTECRSKICILKRAKKKNHAFDLCGITFNTRHLSLTTCAQIFIEQITHMTDFWLKSFLTTAAQKGFWQRDLQAVIFVPAPIKAVG